MKTALSRESGLTARQGFVASVVMMAASRFL